jgi:hypothetical protein
VLLFCVQFYYAMSTGINAHAVHKPRGKRIFAVGSVLLCAV